MHKFETIADKVRRLRTAAGMTQAEFAQRLLVSRDYISQIENGREPGPRLVQQIELIEKVGIPDVKGDDSVGIVMEDPPVYGGIPSLPRFVPVISWARAGQATSYEEIPTDWQEKIFTECRDMKAFAIQVEGDSMTPDFRPGDVVIVMPSHEPRNHAPVVAKLKSDGVVLKILNLNGPDGRSIRLTSINSIYQPTDYAPEDFHWIYPVHSSRRLHWR